MRALAVILVAAAILFGVYHFYLKKLPVTDAGTASTQAINLTGVRTNLLQIAQAERSYVAINGNCASIEELISSKSLFMTRTERDGYAYSVQCTGGDFTAIARHASAPVGSSVLYPNFAIDAGMQVHEID